MDPLPQPSVTTDEVMAVVMTAVQQRDKEAFLRQLKERPQSRRIISDEFHKQRQWLCPKQKEAAGWVFFTLLNGGEGHLALIIAMMKAEAGEGELLSDFLRLNPDASRYKSKRTQAALAKVFELVDSERFKELVEECMTLEERSFLFYQAARTGKFPLAVSLSTHRLMQVYMQLAIPFFLATQDYNLLQKLIGSIHPYNKRYFLRQAVHLVMESLFDKNMTHQNLNVFYVIFHESHCYKLLFLEIFKIAVAKAVGKDATDFVLKIFAYFFSFYTNRKLETRKDDIRGVFSPILHDEKKFRLLKAVCEQLDETLNCTNQKIITKHLMRLVLKEKTFYYFQFVGTCLIRKLDSKEVKLMLLVCFEKMVTKEIPISCASALDTWLKSSLIDFDFKFINDMVKTVSQRATSAELSSLAQYCVEESHIVLAMLLGAALADKTVMAAVLYSPALDLPQEFLLAMAQCTAVRKAYAVAAIIFSRINLSHKNLRAVRRFFQEDKKGVLAGCDRLSRRTLNFADLRAIQCFLEEDKNGLIACCESEGLVLWAACLSTFLNNGRLEERLGPCDNKVVLEHFLTRSAEKNDWGLVKKLLPRCLQSDQDILFNILVRAVECNQLQVAKDLINLVDISYVVDTDDRQEKEINDTFTGKTLLSIALTSYSNHLINKLYYTDISALEMVSMLIESGLSTVQRRVRVENRSLVAVRDIICPALTMFLVFSRTSHLHRYMIRRGQWGQQTRKTEEEDTVHFHILSMLLKSGSLTNTDLHRLHSTLDFNSSTPLMKKGCEMVAKAASDPGRLEHLARLAVSHWVGYCRGRQERIQSLPVPQTLKDMVNFKDVVSLELGAGIENSS